MRRWKPYDKLVSVPHIPEFLNSKAVLAGRTGTIFRVWLKDLKTHRQYGFGLQFSGIWLSGGGGVLKPVDANMLDALWGRPTWVQATQLPLAALHRSPNAQQETSEATFVTAGAILVYRSSGVPMLARVVLSEELKVACHDASGSSQEPRDFQEFYDESCKGGTSCFVLGLGSSWPAKVTRPALKSSEEFFGAVSTSAKSSTQPSQWLFRIFDERLSMLHGRVGMFGGVRSAGSGTYQISTFLSAARTVETFFLKGVFVEHSGENDIKHWAIVEATPKNSREADFYAAYMKLPCPDAFVGESHSGVRLQLSGGS